MIPAPGCPARPRGCWPFKRRGRRRGASCLRCFCLSVSERSWAEAAERISRGQVRKAKQVPLSSLRGFLCVRLCVFLHFDALRSRRLLVSETSFVKRRFSPFPRSAPLRSSPLLSPRSNDSSILQNHRRSSEIIMTVYQHQLLGLIRCHNVSVVLVYLEETVDESLCACLFVQSISDGGAVNEKNLLNIIIIIITNIVT